MGDRGRHPRPGSRNAGEGAPGSVAAIVAALFDLWEKELPRLSGKSKLAEAIRYAISRRIALERFLSDGRIGIDSNIVWRCPSIMNGKSSLCYE